MNKWGIIFWVFFLWPACACSRDTTVTLSAKQFDHNQVIILGGVKGWEFKKGNNLSWADPSISTDNWENKDGMPHIGLLFGRGQANTDGRLEGWLRLKFKVDSSLAEVPLYLGNLDWAASELFLDGQKIRSYGIISTNKSDFRNNKAIDKRFLNHIHLLPGRPHIIAIHFVHYFPGFPFSMLPANDSVSVFPMLTGPAFFPNHAAYYSEYGIYNSVWVAICGVLAILFWILYFENRSEKNLLPIAVCTTFFLASRLTFFLFSYSKLSYMGYLFLQVANPLFTVLMIFMIPVIIIKVFAKKISLKILLLLVVLASVAYINFLFWYITLIPLSLVIILAGLSVYYVIRSWKNIRGAQWAIVAGLLVNLLWASLYLIKVLVFKPPLPDVVDYKDMVLLTGIYLSFPLSLLVYISLRFNEIIKTVRRNAEQVVKLSEEKRQQALNQQVILEQHVKERTAELSQSLENLKSTQAQLVQSEKMASLGELTAGIAHEIQNPLNFVNNFSEVNKEMIDELQAELKSGNIDEAIVISNEIKNNEEKINHHGRRADVIVKNMLQHSRQAKGVKEPTGINALCDEYLRLAYHGMRAKDKNFNAEIKTDFDETIGKINIVPQDIGRVLLNLFNNAFYAVNEKKKLLANSYQPIVKVKTRRINDKVEIVLTDNGNGIAQNIIDKIFQPFFTTKPTGQGTGLGLSLSYDIAKTNGGEITVKSKNGEGSEFIIKLPLT